jgi:hypothetical protein
MDKPPAEAQPSSAREFTEISSPLQKAGAKLLDIAFPQGLFPLQTIEKEGDFCGCKRSAKK